MIKQYDFPRIFHNIVGEVIPITLKNRQTQVKYLNLASQQVEGSSSRFHLKEQETIKGKLTLKSKKKQIVRRMKFNKTLGCFSLRKYISQEDKSSQNDNQSQFKKFLKRKPFAVQKTQRTQRFEQNVQRNAEYEQSMKNEDQVSSNIVKLQPQKTSKRHMSSIRLRTSIDQYSKYEMDKAIQEIVRNPNKRASQINPNLCIKESISTRSKIKHKTFFNFDIKKDDKMEIEDVGSRRNSDRKKTKKKTVNFIVLQDEKENSDRKNISRKGSKMNTLQRQTKLNQNSKKPTSKQLSKTSLLNQSSQWSARTVVSIKFDSNCHLNSKKSLRSQQSILMNSSINFTIKKTKSNNRYGTKTFLKFTQRGQMNSKKYKSMKSISQVSIDIKSQKSVKRSKVKNKQTNKTLVTSSNVKKILKVQNQNKAASILVKTAQPYLITDSVKSIEHKSTFQELIFKKSTKGLFKACRPNTEPDIFTELNNFHKYLNENDAQQNDQDLQRVLTKPMVLNSKTLHRTQFNPQIQRQQNFTIDMGLKLIKKMSILKQKKF